MPPRFPRLLTAMATPFDEDGALDVAAARTLAAHLVDHGSGGLVVAGTTGESPTLDHRETLELFRAVVDAVGDRAAVLAGTGKNDTRATIQLTEEAAACGVDGILLVSPYYNRPSQAGLDAHVRAVASATDLPLMLYDIPARTGVELAAPTILRLAEEVPAVVGVKDAVGDMAKASWLVARAPDGFALWSGDDKNCLPLLAVGGYGLVSVASHLVGDDLAAMLDVYESDPAKAREIHLRLLPLFEALFADSSPGPLKAALRVVGLPGGGVRLPLVEPGEDVVALLRAALRAAGVEGREVAEGVQGRGGAA